MTDEFVMSRRGMLATGSLVLGLGAVTATTACATRSAGQFGAVGDGVTDDTEALQAALDAIFDPAAPGAGILTIPPGVYKITRTLRVDVRRHLGNQRRVVAYGARLLSAITDGSHVLHIRSDAYWRFMSLEGLDILGSGTDGHGLYLDCDDRIKSLYNFCLRDLVIRGCGGDGCRMYGNVFESQVVGCRFVDNRENGATFAHSPHGGVLSAIHVFGCSFDDNAREGAAIITSYDIAFEGCAFRRNGGFGLFAGNGCELVSGCRFEDNHRTASGFENGGAGMGLRRFATLIGCSGYSTSTQTHLIDADVSGSLAQLVMVGCSGGGQGAAQRAGLARLRGSGIGAATIIGCTGAIASEEGFEALTIADPAGGVRFGADWRSQSLFRLGDHRLWVDHRGRLRLKNGVPTSDEDGAVVGGP